MMSKKSNYCLMSHQEFTPDESITHLAAGRNCVIIATKDKKVVVTDTATSKQTDCDLARFLGTRLAQSKLYKLFSDPTGKFTLISLAYAADSQPMENLLYVKRLQSLPRLKNHLISAVAWNHPKTNFDTNSNSTGTILLGTTKGLILQAEFVHSDESKFFPLSPGPRQYVKEVFDVGPDFGPITGLEYHQIPSNSQSEKSFVIIFTTSNRLYRMVGSVTNTDPPPLHLIFAQNSSSYKDVPGKFKNVKLDFYYPSPNKPPNRFAWLVEPGILTGVISNKLPSNQPSSDSNEELSIIPYNTTPDYDHYDQVLSSSFTSGGMSPTLSTMGGYIDKPISMVVMNFHVIILFRYSIKAVCILNEATIYEESFKYGEVLGMCKDPVKNTIWVYSERAIFRYKLLNEDKNVWKIYLDKKDFELAKSYSMNDKNNYDRVICEEAQHYFKNMEYEKSAEIYASSKKPFEEVSLMFMGIKNFRALKKYLLIRFEQLDPSQTTRMTMILAWLLEIIMSSISVAKTLPKTDRNQQEIADLYMDLEQLLEDEQVLECFNQHSKLFYEIMRNYSDLETFVRVAKLIGDYEHVVQYYMDLGELNKALDIMRVVKRDDLFYTHGHILMKRMPKELVDAFMEQSTIKPSKLIPILIQENPYFNKCSETIRYLEFCIRNSKTKSSVIHNYLFELYARHRDEETLIKYLENEASPDMVQKPLLDLQLCLRLCTELKLIKTCVNLYSYMGLFDEALDLALGFDIELAKSIAAKANSEDHQKRLWLLIAQNVLTKNLDIQIATNLLCESKLLKIEDILPFFPDYTTIDFFKDAIRQSLKEYKDQIKSLKDGTYDNIADEIRGEIKTFRNRYSIIKISQRCELCSKNLLSRTFHVFPCGHLFHSDCIIKEIVSIDPNYKGIDEKLKQLTLDTRSSAYIRHQNLAINSVSSQNRAAPVDSKERIVTELDQIISSECIYCGSLLTNYIDKPPPANLDQSNFSEL